MMTNPLNHNYERLQSCLNKFLPEKLHHKQKQTIFNAVLGIIKNKSLRISEIGRGLATAKRLKAKPAIKQVDRLLSNPKLPKVEILKQALKTTLKNKKEALLTLDWTSFAKDEQMTLAIRHVTNHGRAIPLLWINVSTSGLKGNKVKYENQLLVQLKSMLPKALRVVLLADREFGSIERFERLKSDYGFEFVIRFKVNTHIVNEKGCCKTAKAWLGGYRHRTFRRAKLTLQEYPVAKILVCHEKGMKDIWCLACSDESMGLKRMKHYYSKRWGTESSFRDEKDRLFGFGLSKTHIGSLARRDILFLLSTLATLVLTLLGRVSEVKGYDKTLRANTHTLRRTHSLFTQGCYLFNWLLTENQSSISKIWDSLEKQFQKHTCFTGAFSCL